MLVEQALLLLEGNYVHLPLKSAMHAVNPVQRLRLLRARLLRQTAETMDPERIFHAEMSAIFHSVRDLHTNYLLPAPFAGMIAYLPFQVERCIDGGGEKYIVTRVAQGMSAPAVRRRRRDHALERHADRRARWRSTPTGSPAATWPPGSPAASTR